MRPSTPGTTNNPAGLMTSYAPDPTRRQAVGTTVPGYSPASSTPRVIDPTSPIANNPNVIPALAQRQQVITAWDNSGGGNGIRRPHDLRPQPGQSFAVGVPRHRNLPLSINTSAVSFRGSEFTFYGIGTGDVLATRPTSAAERLRPRHAAAADTDPASPVSSGSTRSSARPPPARATSARSSTSSTPTTAATPRPARTRRSTGPCSRRSISPPPPRLVQPGHLDRHAGQRRGDLRRFDLRLHDLDRPHSAPLPSGTARTRRRAPSASRATSGPRPSPCPRAREPVALALGGWRRCVAAVAPERRDDVCDHLKSKGPRRPFRGFFISSDGILPHRWNRRPAVAPPATPSFHAAGRLDEAQAVYRQVLSLDPEQAGAWNLLGVVAHQQGRYAEALDFTGRAIRLRPDVADFYANHATALRSTAQEDRAADALNKALAMDPRCSLRSPGWPQLRTQQNRLDDAERLLRVLTSAHPSAAGWISLGQLLAFARQVRRGARRVREQRLASIRAIRRQSVAWGCCCTCSTATRTPSPRSKPRCEATRLRQRPCRTWPARLSRRAGLPRQARPPGRCCPLTPTTRPLPACC